MGIAEKNGCRDMDGTMIRFLSDEDFYARMLRLMLSDEAFDKLGGEIERGEAEAAFETAHMLKGVILNCGITPMAELIVPIVESLRVGDAQSPRGAYKELMSERDRFSRLL
ncbi:MAG: Hpt domain-containing protein [Clostridia bacterium]|nr:Hpt domain-containing protein [Clostridia bacterium]